MQIRYSDLNRYTDFKRQRMFCLSGEEPLQLKLASDTLRKTARDAGYLERTVYDVDIQFKWDNFLLAFNNLSLFSAKKLIELRFEKASFNKEALKYFQEAVRSIGEDYAIIIHMPKIASASKRTAWFKLLDKHAIMLAVWPLNAQQSRILLQQYATSIDLDINTTSLQIILDSNQNNLLAAAQELDKLKLGLSANTRVDENNLHSILAQSSKYTIFDLSTAFLQGETIRSIQILHALIDEDEAPSKIIWVMLKDLRHIANCHAAMQAGQAMDSVLQQLKVPHAQQQYLSTAARRFTPAKVAQSFSQALAIERSIKGLNKHDIWQQFEKLLIH